MNTQPSTPLLPGLLAPTIEIIDDEIGEVRTLLAWKRVRSTSAFLYQVLQDTGLLDVRRRRVLNACAAIRNKTQRWPTSCEILAWLVERKQLANDNVNQVKPRCSELADGWTEHRVGVDNDGRPARLTVFVPCDIFERGPKRKSDITGHTALTWMIRGRA